MAVDNYALGQRDGAIASARAWEEYAHKLEQAILALRKGEEGHRALERALIADLKPGSKLLDRESRRIVYEQAKQTAKVTVSGN